MIRLGLGIQRAAWMAALLFLTCGLAWGQCDITYNPLTGFFDCVGGTGGSGTSLTAATTSGADNIIWRAVGDSRAVEATGVTITDTGQVVAPGGMASTGVTAGVLQLNEPAAAGTEYIGWKAPATLGASTLYVVPSTPPSGLQALLCNTPSGGDSLCSFGSVAATQEQVFFGRSQNGQNAWNMDYFTLTNYTWSTVDSTNITPMLVVNSGATGSALRSVSKISTTLSNVKFQATVRSTDGTNAGSVALAYWCVAGGDQINNPSYTSLTALSMPTIDPDSETFETTQAVTCSGTPSNPSRLYVTWTPTAPSGGTLSLISLALVY